jgi:hypothetical protein
VEREARDLKLNGEDRLTLRQGQGGTDPGQHRVLSGGGADQGAAQEPEGQAHHLCSIQDITEVGKRVPPPLQLASYCRYLEVM